MRKKFVLQLIVVICIIACDNETQQYEIIDRRATPSGDTAFVVYTPDTNWVAMEKFAAELLKRNRKWSAVGFFNPREKAKKLNTDFSIADECKEYLVATYRFSEERNDYYLYKSKDRFRKDMKFKPSAKLDK